MDWQRRRQLDFWLLAGMIGLWVYWFFLYRTRLLDLGAIKFYLWLFKRNILPILLFCAALAIVFWCFRKKRFALGTVTLLLTIALGYWAYGPDFPKKPPLNPPKVFWKQLPNGIPVTVVISYNYHEELPPPPFLKVQEWLYRKKIRVTEKVARNLLYQVREGLMDLIRAANEGERVFEKCLNLAAKRVKVDEKTVALPIFAEKRYEHVTGQLCWVFGFVEFTKETDGEFWTLKPSFDNWVAVRLRFPQKAWLTYLAVEPEHALPGLIKVAVVLLGYTLFLLGLRYVFQRWY